MMSAFMLFAAFCMLPQAVFSQDGNPPSATWCEDNPGFGDWDFWVGEWDVYATAGEGAKAGTNSIVKHYANCLITETWVSAGGAGGFSMNFYNPVKGHWRQLWVANGYSIDYTGGLDDQGRMVLEGEIDGYQAGTSTPFRGIWTPQGNGDVIQRFEILDAESGDWNVWFEGRYVRK
jgi:hypothetical protein